ncbi:hypothetical protein D3C81_1764180 [compost metagenome]
MQDLQTRIVRRNHELLTQGNHVGIDLQYREAGRRQMLITIFDERAATEADQQDMFGSRIEQQETRHRLRIVDQQFIRCRQAHRTLYDAFVKMQCADITVIEDKGLAVLRQGLEFRNAFRREKIHR